MNTVTLTNQYRPAYSHKLILWIIFAIYVVTVLITMMHHEPWTDELHSWNIAKGSAGYADLIHNIRFEGHPPLWYTILWSVSKFTHSLGYMQAVQFILASSFTFIVLFYSPFPVTTKILIPFGYFFLFEYAVLSRNYAAGVLFAFCICLIMHKNFRGRNILYYVLLLLMSNVHLFSMVLAGSLHLYFLLLIRERKGRASLIALHVLLGIIVFLPALLFIYPPSDGGLKLSYWISNWNTDKLSALSQAPLRSLFPMPAWWNFKFWNTQFLVEWKLSFGALKFINPLISFLLLLSTFLVLRKNRKSLVLFTVNLLLTFVIAVIVFPLVTARYAGFIYISFLAAYWLYCYETPVSRNTQWIVNSILIVHLIAGVFAVYKDIRYPFSNLYTVNELLKEVPANEIVVTDYWALNAVSAYAPKKWYCIDMQQEMSFIRWGSDLERIKNKTHRYYDGVTNLFQKTGSTKIFMISMGSPEILLNTDDTLFKAYHVTLIDSSKDMPIEKGSNLYLYEIKSF